MKMYVALFLVHFICVNEWHVPYTINMKLLAAHTQPE